MLTPASPNGLAGALPDPRILPLPTHTIARRSLGAPRAIAAPADHRVRWHRLMTARARIAVGFYDRPDVRASLAEAVLRELQRS